MKSYWTAARILQSIVMSGLVYWAFWQIASVGFNEKVRAAFGSLVAEGFRELPASIAQAWNIPIIGPVLAAASCVAVALFAILQFSFAKQMVQMLILLPYTFYQLAIGPEQVSDFKVWFASKKGAK